MFSYVHVSILIIGFPPLTNIIKIKEGGRDDNATLTPMEAIKMKKKNVLLNNWLIDIPRSGFIIKECIVGSLTSKCSCKQKTGCNKNQPIDNFWGGFFFLSYKIKNIYWSASHHSASIYHKPENLLRHKMHFFFAMQW